METMDRIQPLSIEFLVGVLSGQEVQGVTGTKVL